MPSFETRIDSVGSHEAALNESICEIQIEQVLNSSAYDCLVNELPYRREPIFRAQGDDPSEQTFARPGFRGNARGGAVATHPAR